MLASTAAALRPPLRRVRGGAFPSGASHGGTRGAIPLFPRPRRRALACRADLQQDAPFAAAIGACVLASLVLPPPRPRGEEGEEVEEGGEFGATDTRMAVMGIISFLPYFNWLSWIFAWLDSGRRRYLVYAAVYLAPYLRIFPSAAKEKDGHRGNKRDSIGMGDRHNRRIPSAHESRERLRNSDIFKRKLDEPNEEKQNKSDWN
ncbi:unnamed protein product [Urochloa decumbens]|uniref:Uncharacterized protein n=1 Tax=Urochloa decumbens TaxID=240449 RepID=A0ABC9C5M5_9POAL